MKYTVVWEPTAESELAELWMRATDRDGVAWAADRIDALLLNNPQQRGEPHSGARRTLIVPPLGIIFKVEEDDRKVRVLAVWYIPAALSNGSSR